MMIPVSWAMAALMVWFSSHPSENPWLRVACIIGAIVVVVGTVFAVKSQLKAGPRIVINESGILDIRRKIGTIPWSDIKRVSIITFNFNPFLCVHLVDMEAFIKAFPSMARNVLKFNELSGISGFSIAFGNLTHTPGDALEYINANIERFKNIEQKEE